MTTNPNIVDALKAVIALDWDQAGEMADEHQFVDCLRCFAAPRRILFSTEAPCVYMCLFCASCWYAHEKHRNKRRNRKAHITACEICDVVGHHKSMEEFLALRNLRAAERRYLEVFGWTRNGQCWDPPKDQRFKYKSGYTHNHAVNALKHRHGKDQQEQQPRNPDWRPTLGD